MPGFKYGDCEACGGFHARGVRCNPRVLARIDAMHRRASLDAEDMRDDLDPVDEGDRLNDGFFFQGLSGDDDGE